MGRNRTPSALLDAKGAYLINPQRKHPNEPRTGKPLGSPPKYFSPEQKKVWKEIQKRLPRGVAFASDRDAFELLVRLTTQMRYGVRLPDGTVVPGEQGMKAADRMTLISLWSRFGMTPSDRSKVSAEQPPESKLDKFLSRAPAPAPQAEETIQ